VFTADDEIKNKVRHSMPYGSVFNRGGVKNGKNEDRQNDSFDNCFAISDSGPFHQDDS